MRFSKAVFGLLLLAACAKVVAPSGGPEDRDPPEVVSISPEPGFQSVVPSRVVIEYSERISGSESLVEVFPAEAVVTIEDRRIVIRTDDGGSVLTATVSGQLQDRRGNPVGEPLNLVWNSVPRDDFAWIRGLLSRSGGGEVTELTRCDLFLLPDTSDAYLTGYPDSTDTVLMGWLPEGDYRVVCYEDNDMSRSWDPEREPGAFELVTLVPGDTASFSLTMTIVDSIGPVISPAEAIDGWHVEIGWNEQVRSPGADGSGIRITGPDGMDVPLLGAEVFRGRSSTGLLTVYTGERLQDTLYTVSAMGIEDLAGNPSLPDSIEFWAVDSLPSYPFAVQSAYPEDGGTDVPPSGPFVISFSDWVDLETLTVLYGVTRVYDQTPVPGELIRTAPTAFEFHPEGDLLGEKQYRIDLDSGLVSLQGDTLAGKSWTFVPAWSESPGSVSGRITGIASSVVSVVVSAAGGGDMVIRGDYAPGDYRVEEVPGGRYTVSCFVDRNGSGVWDPGEPYGAWPGVIEVLPGMETPDVDLQVVP